MREDTRQRINELLNQLVVLLAFSIPLYRKWVSIAAALIVILWLAEGRLADKLAALKRHRLTVAVAAFVGFAALSLAWSGDPASGLAYLAKYRYLLLVPIIATSLRDDSRDRVETAFLIGTALSLAVSYAVFAGLVRFRDAYPGNPAPSMSHLDYSMVLAVGGLIALARLLEEERPLRQRLAWAALTAFVVSGLLINIGRSGQVAFVGAALVLTPVILGRRSRRARRHRRAPAHGMRALPRRPCVRRPPGAPRRRPPRGRGLLSVEPTDRAGRGPGALHRDA